MDYIKELREQIFEMACECPYLDASKFHPTKKHHIDSYELTQMSCCISHMNLLTRLLEKHNRLQYFKNKRGGDNSASGT